MSNYNKRKIEEAKKKKQQLISMCITCVIIVAIIGAVVAVVWKTQQKKSEANIVKEIKYDPFEYVTLGDYEGKEVYKVKAEVTDEDVQKKIDELLEKGIKYSEVEDRGVLTGDQLTIDFKGLIDGKEFSGGTSKDYTYICGQGSMIDGFDEGLMGAMKSETKTLNLKFPEDYQTSAVAGKDVVFEITVNKIEMISEQPKWDDAYVKVVSQDKFDTTQAYEKNIREDLLIQDEKTNETSFKNQLWESVTKTATFDGYPKELYKQMDAKMGDQLTQSATQYGMDRDTYVKMLYGSTYSDYLVQYINSEMISKALIQKLELKLSDSEYDKLAKESLSDFGMSSVEKLEEAYTKKAVSDYLLNNKLFEYLESKAVVKEVTKAEYEEIQKAALEEKK